MASGATAESAERPTPAPAPERSHVTVAYLVKVGAGIVILTAGLKLASSLFVPIALAAFLAMICNKPVAWLTRKGVPAGLAIGLVLIALSVLLLLTAVLVGGSASEFTAEVPKYQKNLDSIVGGLVGKLDDLGIDVDETKAQMAFDSKRLLELVSDVIKSLIGALSDVFMILLLVIFMLADAQSLPARLRAAYGGPDADLSRFHRVAESVNTYLWVKTWVSALTGLCIGVFAAVIGLDFPFLWGFLAFIFNFIPNIGSLIAAVPAVLLALLQGGWDLALITGVGFLVVNNVIGNVVEPRVLGQKMGLTSLVVFLSLLVWSWLWGPIGMLLSVPLTMVIKIALESMPDGKRIAALLGPTAED